VNETERQRGEKKTSSGGDFSATAKIAVNLIRLAFGSSWRESFFVVVALRPEWDLCGAVGSQVVEGRVRQKKMFQTVTEIERREMRKLT
jgi:hypothetical protein